MRKLSAESYNAAVGFLETNGRPLDLALFRHAFCGGSVDAALRALAAFQNPDGGYGQGLEPDAAVAESSVLDTTHALRVMARLQTPPDHPQLTAAMDYFRATHEGDFAGWPVRPFASLETACAPWWKSADVEAWRQKMRAGRLNPTPEVLGYFLEYGRSADRPLIDRVTDRLSGWIDGVQQPLELHDLLCLSRLVRAERLEAGRRAGWVARVCRDAALVVNPDPAGWDTYGLKPWGIAEAPGDPLLDDLAPGLFEAMLDHEICRQESDGGWPPFWDWSGLHPEAWEVARVAWKSAMTEQMLRVLRAHGRLPTGAV